MDSIKPTLYGTDWCPKTTGFKNYFQLIGIRYDYYNVEKDPEAEQAVKDMNGGKIKFPMVVVGEKKLKNPSIQDLNIALNSYGLLSQQTE
ncbi:glutaredoxin family protein [Rhodocytophaga aerolata]|uniref:Glutaredoxin family protein n=1 Tax=Rhodocytophaga aerolata TaxID=455078 RepID=A0ABT8R7Z3_9BACT|nr:glutaredoxin family protein [Rhodocytophaga aerolata]MDO1446800.1 glutaredoxin family protein [Rhodocytophaga aerolata]